MNACSLISIILLATLVISGCTTTRTAPVGPTQATSYYKPVTDVSGVEAGSVVSVDINETGTRIEGRFGAPYASASGKVCRYFRPVSGDTATRTLCKLSDGGWYFQKSLNPRILSIRSSDPLGPGAAIPEVAEATDAGTSILAIAPNELSILPVPESVTLDSQAPIAGANSSELADVVTVDNFSTRNHQNFPTKSKSFVIQKGENLWSFSRRVTGAGKNWPLIARENGIAEQDNVHAGARLAVPHELLVD